VRQKRIEGEDGGLMRPVRLLGRLGFRIGRPRKKTEALRIKAGLKAIV
jgi:hypothetical protein